MPDEWQKIIVDVLNMKRRIDFGIQINDRDLNEKQQFAIEVCQDMIYEKKKKEK